MEIPALLWDSCPKKDGLLVDQSWHPASFGLLLQQMPCKWILKQRRQLFIMKNDWNNPCAVSQIGPKGKLHKTTSPSCRNLDITDFSKLQKYLPQFLLSDIRIQITNKHLQVRNKISKISKISKHARISRMTSDLLLCCLNHYLLGLSAFEESKPDLDISLPRNPSLFTINIRNK